MERQMRSWCWHDWTPWRSYVTRYRKSHVSHHGTLSTDVTETRQARRCNKCHREQHVIVDNGVGAMWENIQDGYCAVSADAVDGVRPTVQ
jgi:hypothetical protein